MACFVLMSGRFPFYFDDAFISFRITENLKAGYGPFLNKGEAVYSSTSLMYPFFNLLPALIHGENWIDFIPYWNGLMIALSFGICLLVSFNQQQISFRMFLLVILPFLPWIFGHRNLTYANSGLETGLYMLAISACLHLKKLHCFSPWLIFIRPEGWLAGWALLIENLLIRDKKAILKSSLHIIASLFFWWMAGYTLFGTPLPQSIFAKANHSIDRINEIQKGISYAMFAGHLIPFAVFLFAFYRFRDYRKKVRISLLWTLLYLGFFSFGAAWWPWYLPPLYAAFWYMSLSAGFRILADYQLSKLHYYLIFLVIFSWSGRQILSDFPASLRSSTACRERMKASRDLADYLRKNTSNHSSVLLEPLGMMAWYGPEIRIRDYPGLANPEMAEFLRDLPWKIPHRLTDSRTDSAILHHFKPEVLVLWPEEEEAFRQTNLFSKDYRISAKLPYFPEEKRLDSVSVFVRIRS